MKSVHIRKKKRISCAILLMKSRCLDTVIEFMIALSQQTVFSLARTLDSSGAKQ